MNDEDFCPEEQQLLKAMSENDKTTVIALLMLKHFVKRQIVEDHGNNDVDEDDNNGDGDDVDDDDDNDDNEDEDEDEGDDDEDHDDEDHEDEYHDDEDHEDEDHNGEDDEPEDLSMNGQNYFNPNKTIMPAKIRQKRTKLLTKSKPKLEPVFQSTEQIIVNDDSFTKQYLSPDKIEEINNVNETTPVTSSVDIDEQPEEEDGDSQLDSCSYIEEFQLTAPVFERYNPDNTKNSLPRPVLNEYEKIERTSKHLKEIYKKKQLESSPINFQFNPNKSRLRKFYQNMTDAEEREKNNLASRKSRYKKKLATKLLSISFDFDIEENRKLYQQEQWMNQVIADLEERVLKYGNFQYTLFKGIRTSCGFKQ